MLQLQIDEQIDLTEYNARVAGTPDYDLIVRQNGIRLLVIDTYYNLTIDRDVFDFCLFLKDGEASVLRCRGYGEPGITFPIARLSLDQLRNQFPKCDCWRPCCSTSAIQNNILYPLTCKTCGKPPFPFGNDCWDRWQRVSNCFNFHDIWCACPGGPWQWLG